ncbi:SLC13 family permease [Vulgatibacter incomptus]|uniref:Arsenic efflux pump protein n=1 Tax=Vulgatibacter incomptus TaxID=1391653 RepID=A0A0K1PC79_9BACT|nr:SLC13 family permease [Vulgatibacter incomptus]AKU90704.1 Arsenic efflux pump protein [Vulgatibacter incomptus]
MTAALIVFAITYLFILGQPLPFIRLERPAAALVGAVAMVVVGAVSPAEAYRDAIDYQTLALLLGMMILTGYLQAAGFFRWASHAVIRGARTPRRLLAGITVICAALSALLVNDTVCLMVTPLVVQVIDDSDLPPLPFLLAIAFGANAGSAATPTGNPQNMLIASLSGLSFQEFVGSLGPAAVAATAVVLLLLFVFFGRQLPERPLVGAEREPPATDRVLLAKSLVAIVGVVIAFIAGANLAWSALAGAAFLLLVAGNMGGEVLREVNWLLLLFFAGLFIVVYGVGQTGVAERLFDVAPLAGAGEARQAIAFSAISIVGSNLFSNVPFVILAAKWIPAFADPLLAWKTLALASTLAGNLTIVGSVANLIVFEIAGARGRVSFWRFLGYGLPITLGSTAAGVVLLLLFR